MEFKSRVWLILSNTVKLQTEETFLAIGAANNFTKKFQGAYLGASSSYLWHSSAYTGAFSTYLGASPAYLGASYAYLNQVKINPSHPSCSWSWS